MEALGPHGLAVVVDLIDAIALGTGGIHIVVTDRPQAVRAELSARCPVGWVVAPLLSPERDRLSDAAQGEPGKQGVLLVDVVVPEDAGERAALHALNDSREWLLRRGTCAVVIVAGKDARRADAAYLELQAHAPDFWSVRSRVHRVVGPDTTRAMRDELLDLLSVKLEGDRAAAQRWLDGRSVEEDWVTYRLWREGPRRAAWLELAEPSTEGEDVPMLGLDELLEANLQGKLHEAPVGEAIAPERWRVPRWPSGRLDAAQQSLVKELGAALDRDGRAELWVLPEDEASEALGEVVLTLGLLRESRHRVVLHLDARSGLAGAIATLLREAGDTAGGEGLLAAIRRLDGALGSADTLLVVTDVTPTELAFLRAETVERPVVATVRGEPVAAFCVAASSGRAEPAKWASAQLSAWPLGATTQQIRAETAELDLRVALGRAHHVIVLIDATWNHWMGTVAQTLERPAHRVAAFALAGEARIDVGFAASWHGVLGPDEATAQQQLLGVARGLGGEPISGSVERLRYNRAASERVERIRGLAEERPDVYLHRFGLELIPFALSLSDLGRHEDALRVMREILAIHRPMAEDRPEERLHDLLVSLYFLGAVHLRAGSPAAAVASFAEGLRLGAPLAERDSIVPMMARNLRRAADESQSPIPEDLVSMLEALPDDSIAGE